MRKTDLPRLERNILGLTGLEASEKVFLYNIEVYREREMPPVLSL